jgi:ribonuclease P protein component
MRKQQRLRTRRDFTAIYRGGRFYGYHLVGLRALANGGELTRFGFAVSKGIGKAVARNRVRRRLREGVRALSVAPGWDIVIIARPPAAAADYHELRDAVAGLLLQAGVLCEERVKGENEGTC